MAQHLLQSAFGYVKFPFGRLLRFLGKDVEHDNTSSNNGAVEYSGNPFLPFDASLEESFPMARVCGKPRLGPNSSIKSVSRK
jgi:hypothetical protein